MLIKYIASERTGNGLVSLSSHPGIISWEKREPLTFGHFDIKC